MVIVSVAPSQPVDNCTVVGAAGAGVDVDEAIIGGGGVSPQRRKKIREVMKKTEKD
ncbi:hypothetical protein [Chlamydia vaughanii]|uniref:hypothetical protein n=1 Tax=Chlamydia vaughanii TaxID=3112552 RepID=UPI0032B303A3